MAKKLLLIINPNAGKGKAGTTLLSLVGEFSACGYEVTVFPTAKKFDALKKTQLRASQYDLVVCCGGDGTISETVNGLARIPEQEGMNAITPFGFVPMGTSNDFATTTEMPSDPVTAAKKIISGRNRPLDIGEFKSRSSREYGKYFFYVAAFGLFTSVSYTVPQDVKKTFGQLSYIMEGIKQAIDIPSYRMKVEFNGKIIRDEFSVGLVMNSTSVAGMFRLNNSKVKLDDGKFELLLVKNPGNPLLLGKVIMDLASGDSSKFDPNYVIFERVSQVKFHTAEPVAWCLDGESGGVYKKIEINNLHRKLNIRI